MQCHPMRFTLFEADLFHHLFQRIRARMRQSKFVPACTWHECRRDAAGRFQQLPKLGEHVFGFQPKLYHVQGADFVDER